MRTNTDPVLHFLAMCVICMAAPFAFCACGSSGEVDTGQSSGADPNEPPPPDDAGSDADKPVMATDKRCDIVIPYPGGACMVDADCPPHNTPCASVRCGGEGECLIDMASFMSMTGICGDGWICDGKGACCEPSQSP